MEKIIEKTINGVLVKAKIVFNVGDSHGVLTWLSPPGAAANGPILVDMNSMIPVESAFAENGCKYDFTPLVKWKKVENDSEVTALATCQA